MCNDFMGFGHTTDRSAALPSLRPREMMPGRPWVKTPTRMGRGAAACEHWNRFPPRARDLTQSAPVEFGTNAMFRDAVNAVDSSPGLGLSIAL